MRIFFFYEFRFFLAAQSSVCKYKDRNQRCNGQAKLRKIIKNSGEVEYIIGCDKWIKGKKWHRYIKVPEEIDLRLLQDVFRGHYVCIRYSPRNQISSGSWLRRDA